MSLRGLPFVSSKMLANSCLQALRVNTIICSRLNSTIAQFGKMKRKVYTRRYPLRIVDSSGSSFDVMMADRPHSIFHVPYDTSHLNARDLAKYKLERKIKVSSKNKNKVLADREKVSDSAIDFDHSNFL